jgi:histidyl-tRNA synthetase
MRLRNWLFEHFRTVAHRFGFEEVDAPLVEHAELFIRKAGEEIVEQLYHFELHDRHLALRAEFTPSLARMILARQGSIALPLRWFSIPQCWRYERMTRGRRREHYQWNMDVWGVPGVEAEAELIATSFALLDAVGLDRGAVRMRVSSRKLLDEVLRSDRVALAPERFQPLCIVIDKLDKLGPDAVLEQLADPAGPVALPRGAAEEVLGALSSRSLEDVRTAVPSDSPALSELARLLELLDAYGLGELVAFDASVVRGLAYYTGVVFEANDREGELRAVCGGGRYDRLLESLGGKAIPAAGFGLGDAVLMELLAEHERLPDLPRGLDAVVIALGNEAALERAAVAHARELRAGGRSVELLLGEPRLKRALKHADRSGAGSAHLVGPDELSRGMVRVRDLRSGEEREEPLSS